jgi:hypothetical protein
MLTSARNEEGLIEMTAMTARKPSEAQLRYLYTLAGDRVAPSLGTCGEERIENLGAKIENTDPSMADVSGWIDWLKRQPRDTGSADATPAQASVTATEPGVYELPDGTIYVVKPNREKTRLYAKRLVEIDGDRLTETGTVVQIDFVYEAGAIYKIQPEHKMPYERARELTVRYSRCIVCGRHLKAAQSVDRGIGPVCRKSFS